MNTAAIILAAGAGTRMKSKKPKVAHEILGKPIVNWVLDATHEADIDRIVAVVGHGREYVEPLVADAAEVVEQAEQLGTAHAVSICRDAFAGFDGSLLVLNGDCPLITPATIRSLVETREEQQAGCVFLTMELSDPTGYGRIVRDSNDAVLGIVEHKDATDAQRAIRECNAGFYCFDAVKLFDALTRVNSDNAQGEFYLTDVIELMRISGDGVIGYKTDIPHECLGINSRVQLAQATKIAQQRINSEHMANGVTIIDPDQVWIGPDVIIEQDVEILPQVLLMGDTFIGEDSVIGPNTRITSSRIGRGVHLEEVVAIEAQVDDCAACDLRAYLRPGTHIRA